MQDLKDVTNNVHYENFRYGKLASVSSNGGKSKAPATKEVKVTLSSKVQCKIVTKFKVREKERSIQR